ncbi:MAG: phosphatidate cytidylyltransferase [Actinomycetota bacterium]|nr:phosphatidate cytidylyltransferase [Actinomycetota bacterium]
MTDDPWRRREEDDDFGPPLFGDGSEAKSSGLSFSAADPLPHWTAPATGELPRVLHSDANDTTDDVDVWSSFSGETPAWSDEPTTPERTRRPASFDDLDAMSPLFDEQPTGLFDDPVPFEEPAPPRREPGRIQIGTDPTDGAMARPISQSRRPRPGEPGARGARPPRPAAPGMAARGPAPKAPGGTKARDMPTAIAVGLVLAAVFLGALKTKPWAVGVIVVLVLGLAAVEYFDRVREKGYQPAFIPGIMACVAAPTAVYHYGVGALPLVAFFAFVACAITFVGAPGLDSNPMPNMAITSLGITWIGLMGSFGAGIVSFSNIPGARNIGTDTLCLLAVGVVANDVGALFVGSAVGRTPLRPWISPNKSVEGFLGGAVATIGAMLLIGMGGYSDTWSSTGDLLLLGLTIAIMAPVGDLTESMFKRNLDVKDFGSIIKGHGGVLDRFDGFLFVMPAVYFLLTYLEPWAA